VSEKSVCFSCTSDPPLTSIRSNRGSRKHEYEYNRLLNPAHGIESVESGDKGCGETGGGGGCGFV